MKIVLWTIVIALSVGICGCTNFACKENVPLGMDEQEALRQIPGIRLIAEEMNRKEYSCQLYEDCDSSHWFRSSMPYKLGFENYRLLRIEVNQDELTRQEINQAVQMRYSYYRW